MDRFDSSLKTEVAREGSPCLAAVVRTFRQTPSGILMFSFASK